MFRFATSARTLIIAASLAATGAAATAQEKFKAITTFTVIADMAQNVAGDAAIVQSITKPGAEIHGYAPTPRDIIRAQDADLILWNGLNLELWFEQFFGNLSDIPSVTLSEGIDPISISGGEYDGKPNPHAWMSLSSALIYVDNIRDAFVTHDPANADIYAANAEAYKQRIAETIEPLRAQIQAVPEAQRWLVSCEGAFGYLTRDFGMKELYLWPTNADSQGTPQQVRRVIDTVRENEVPVVFCESTVNQAPAKQVARETGAAYGGMLYVDSLTEADGPVPTYLDLLRVTTQTVAAGLTR
ncbi:metal ABC transporter substrate-binding protein [uncultured Sulfitobacter sp.]|uniref:metal ABC transporter substrate-binding protein n=1 Tax=uncultured Sulfitobacter sp. TaxID=191468 RepID=UPI0026086807|nr:metal ABC transporter substrate-binding protein [uncultured Sulfitobacter sp.]